MTYNSRPMYGIKESFYGPAAYREAEYQQSIKPQPAQSLAVGDSKTKPTIEGFEKTIYPQPGTKQELMGAGVVAYAQAFETWAEDTNAPEPEPTPEYEAVKFTSTTTYTPAFESGIYYDSNEQSAVALTEQPAGWGTGTFYTRSGEQSPYVFTQVTFIPTTTYSPAFAENTYYEKEGDKYVLLSSQPDDWGTGTYYKVKEAE
nr:MAG TPA: hypothetical protein [Caudoviricetes sp.]